MKNLKYEILKNFDDCLIHIDDIISDHVTTNLTLLKLGKQLFGDRFKNVYCADDKITLKNNECCIINTDSSRQAGTHWCGLYKYRDIYYFFDSFSRDHKTISKYWKNKRWYDIESKRIESFKQSDCRQLSLAFLLIFDKYKTKCIGVV